MVQALGWISSALLVATIVWQVRRQWLAGTSEGVSRYLFIGQLLASTGFCAYSILIGSRVFVVTNALMMISAAAGLAILIVHRRRERGPR
jgi:hypothetical protein